MAEESIGLFSSGEEYAVSSGRLRIIEHVTLDQVRDKAHRHVSIVYWSIKMRFFWVHIRPLPVKAPFYYLSEFVKYYFNLKWIDINI